MSQYVKLDDVLDYLSNVRMNRTVNDSPYMDNALLNVWQILQSNRRNSFGFDWIEVGECDGCRWKGRHQKCSCCRRNRHMKDSYEEAADESL